MDSTNGEASAKANYYLGRCLLELGQDKEGDSFKQRAQAYFEIVYSSYSTTRWAGLAKTAAAK
jgi:TolA-binding protein